MLFFLSMMTGYRRLGFFKVMMEWMSLQYLTMEIKATPIQL